MFYVIKVIDVAEVPDHIGLEAMQEIEIMQLMDSPYIVGYLDSFIDGQKINIVLEYCPMGDLNSLVEKQKIAGKPFVDNMIWKIFIHLCLGIEYLHSKDIIHRDLKSLNVFMIKESIAKIGDLGCALQLEAAADETPAKDIDVAVIKQISLESNPFDVI
jgi:NIMA (never in mitosis gene a)-related kinase